MGGPKIPLTPQADAKLRALAEATGSPAIAAIDGATLLGERAMFQGFRVPGHVSAGGSCLLYATKLPSLKGRGRGWVETRDTAGGEDTTPSLHPPLTPPFQGGGLALNLARQSDIELLPAWLEDDFPPPPLEQLIVQRDPASLLARGREMGLALAAVHEPHSLAPSSALLTEGQAFTPNRKPRILDLSALWAGPLAAHLLALAGAEVIKVESRTRPDAMRKGQPAFFTLLNAPKRQIAIDWHRDALMPLIDEADIVIEASRPRALRQLGIDADALVSERPLVWITITAHGATGEAANWVGFGDDVAVAAGLSAELERVTGRAGFVGDAIADPLTGIEAAMVAWEAWRSGAGGRYAVTMRDVVADAIRTARTTDPAGFDADLPAWAAAEGQPFPIVRDRRC